jgi:hypothetical protein
MEEEILKFLDKKGGKAKTMAVFFMSKCREYSDFSIIVHKLVKNGKIRQSGNDGEYLELVDRNIKH